MRKLKPLAPKPVDGEFSFSVSPESVEVLSNEKGSKRLKIVLVEGGWNKNDIFITEEVLAELPDRVPDKPKLFLNHDMFAWMGRDVNEWAATFEKVWKEDDKVMGEIRFTENPATVWLFEEASKSPDQVQFSIHITGLASDYKDESLKREGKKIEHLASYKSTDIVSYGAAGGTTLKVLNSEMMEELKNVNSPILEKLTVLNSLIESINNDKELDMDIKNLDDLQAAHPDLVKEAVALALASNKGATEIAELKQTTADLQTKVDALEADKTTAAEAAEVLNTEITDLKKENEEIKPKLDEFETKEKLQVWSGEVEEAIKDSEIDTKLVSDFFKAELIKKDKIEDVKAAIEDRKALKSENVINNGPPKKDEEKDEKINDDELIKGLKS